MRLSTVLLATGAVLSDGFVLPTKTVKNVRPLNVLQEPKRYFTTMKATSGNATDVDTSVTMEKKKVESITSYDDSKDLPIHTATIKPAGLLCDEHFCIEDDLTHKLQHRGRSRKRVLVLCTGGTLTMSNDPTKGGSLAPRQGALTEYLSTMRELIDDPEMPEIVAHEYTPLIDSSDMNPGDWRTVAVDIYENYNFFDGFVVLMGTDTMAYAASALSFMFQNLGKPVVFTGSQIPLREPYNDARKNLIMATIFASSDSIAEVSIFFHDRLVRGCRATKINTSKLLAFDSPNLDPLAEIGINIEEREYLLRDPPKGPFRIRTEMDTRLITLRLVPGFDDTMILQMIKAARETKLKGLILQLYGTGNLPSLKDDLIDCLTEASENGVVVVVTTQCHTGSVILGHYATGQALKRAGVVSANDMTLEATTTKLAYLLGRQDLSIEEVRELMQVDLRGEMTQEDAMPPPPLASTYQKAIAKKNRSRRF
ncbi:60kDa lysophospholipase [Chaetoceros tenuissimus]|uniref:asparaginase n=1 Tax=Chaetoceros tenuissimus TaxID=426638 RepID=A0AAD3HE79_9STRA|nr:60kDa lysophospholipase [Chaetoceros tenuissimus]